MNRNELKTLLQERHGRVKDAPHGGIRIKCPTCDAGKSREMKRYIYPNSYYSKCYICEELLEVKDLCGGEVKYERSATVEEPEHPQAREMPLEKAFRLDELPLDHPAIKFFMKDHLYEFEKYSTEYGILYIPVDGGIDIKFPNTTFRSSEALVFPVALDHEIVGWQLRYLPGSWYGDKMISKGIKYMHVFPKGNYLYNFDKARKHDHVIVVEGVKKALKADNAVATWGKGLSERQKDLICKWDRITLMLDGDDKTQSMCVGLKEELKYKMKEMGGHLKGTVVSDKQIVNVDLRKYGFPSPDEMTKEQVAQVVEDAWK
jgi:hypothetical protein